MTLPISADSQIVRTLKNTTSVASVSSDLRKRDTLPAMGIAGRDRGKDIVAQVRGGRGRKRAMRVETGR